MSSRFEYLVRKLDELDDAIRREKREYEKARDRYEKMRSRDILDDLKEQLFGYRTEHDQLQRARSARATPRPRQHTQQQQQQQQQHRPHPVQGAPPPNAQRSQQHAPPPPQYKTTCPHRPNPNQKHSFPPGNGHVPGTTAGPARGQPNSSTKPRPPRPHQKTQMVDFEIEEPDGKSYIVKGGAVFRDFDPARDTVRKT